MELNKVYNIDCIDGMKQMIEQRIMAHTLLTDIPYGEVNRETSGLRNLNKGIADIKTFNLDTYVDLAIKVVKENFVIFCGKEQVSPLISKFKSYGLSTRLLIWQKTNPSPMNGDKLYLSGIETAIYAKKSKGTFNAKCKNTVFSCPSGVNEIHPTQKPLKLWYELINDLTNKEQIVLDTCMGSFTTAVACHKLSRKFIGFELNKDYYKAGFERLNTAMAQTSLFDLNGYESVFDALNDREA